MGMDFNIKPAGAPAVVSFVQPVGDAARDAVATQLPASQTITAADVSARVRNDSTGANAGTSHQTVFDRDAASMVYQVVDNRTRRIVGSFRMKRCYGVAPTSARWICSRMNSCANPPPTGRRDIFPYVERTKCPDVIRAFLYCSD